jgi:cytochrome c oxidase cbb3-type subunit IV
METYQALRTFADSWGLLVLFLFFIGMVIWLFRPGARRLHDDASRQIFRNEDRPRPPEDHERGETRDRTKDRSDG